LVQAPLQKVNLAEMTVAMGVCLAGALFRLDHLSRDDKE
jgi:hypothetical protein